MEERSPGNVALEERIRAQPGHFVAQYPVTPSLSPKWDGNNLVPSAMVMRVFVSAEGSSYRVLPGGLAREPAGCARARPQALRGGGAGHRRHLGCDSSCRWTSRRRASLGAAAWWSRLRTAGDRSREHLAAILKESPPGHLETGGHSARRRRQFRPVLHLDRARG